MSDLTDKTLITELDVRGAMIGTTLRINETALVTPLAADLARERHIRLERIATADRQIDRKIAIGADHRGYEMKEAIKGLLAELGYTCQDFGTNSTETVDYPDIAHAVALAVSRKACDLGIMIDGAGIGSCMVANKVPGVRASMCYDVSTASNAREHNDANVLTLGAQLIGTNLAKQIVKTWLTTDFGGGRHAKRVNKIVAVEQRFLRQ